MNQYIRKHKDGYVIVNKRGQVIEGKGKKWSREQAEKAFRGMMYGKHGGNK